MFWLAITISGLGWKPAKWKPYRKTKKNELKCTPMWRIILVKCQDQHKTELHKLKASCTFRYEKQNSEWVFQMQHKGTADWSWTKLHNKQHGCSSKKTVDPLRRYDSEFAASLICGFFFWTWWIFCENPHSFTKATDNICNFMAFLWWHKFEF